VVGRGPLDSHTAAASAPAPAVAPAAAPAPQPAPATAAPASEVAVPAAVLHKPRGGLLGGGKRALEDENAELRAALAALGATEREQIRHDIERLRSDHAGLVAQLGQQEAELRGCLQEVGIYRYQHPLDSAVAYKERMAAVQQRFEDLAKAGHAVVGATSWQVNGSSKEGSRMVRDFSKLMLRAYNNEADNAVRSMKPHNLGSAVDRLEKARATISRLGKTMSIQVREDYHRLRVHELELTADYLAKVADEKEAEREERARLREEERAQREFEREKARLLKEAAHYQTALAAMQASERMVKIGMTRRLDPLDRVRELGDASVPFRYDVHAGA
jgi:hypothetical protein